MTENLKSSLVDATYVNQTDQITYVAQAAGIAKVLTAEGGPYVLPPTLREMMCFMDDGSLYVSASHDTNCHVLGFMERLGRHGVCFHVEKVLLTQIKKIYENYLCVAESFPSY
jgi:hypothetical protein